MNIGIITNTNKKGQIVIPKKMRSELSITEDMPLHVTIKDNGILIQPINDIVTAGNGNQNAFLELLQITQGVLAGKEFDPKENQRRKIELEASEQRKKVW